MSQVYNAYHSYVLSRSASYLLSDDCLGYASFQAHRKGHGSFAKFSSFLAKDLTLEITGGDNGRSDESESGDSGGSNDEFDRNNEGTALNSDGISVAYNKREMYFSNREMIARRMDKSLPHVVCKVESSKATSCVWCCRKNMTEIIRLGRSIAGTAVQRSSIALSAWSAFVA